MDLLSRLGLPSVIGTLPPPLPVSSTPPSVTDSHGHHAIAPSLPQRSPFAIQELLGLNAPQESSSPSPPPRAMIPSMVYSDSPFGSRMCFNPALLPSAMMGGGHQTQAGNATPFSNSFLGLDQLRQAQTGV